MFSKEEIRTILSESGEVRKLEISKDRVIIEIGNGFENSISSVNKVIDTIDLIAPGKKSIKSMQVYNDLFLIDLKVSEK